MFTLQKLSLLFSFTDDDCVKFTVELLEIVCLQVHLEVHGRVGGPGYQVILEY